MVYVKFPADPIYVRLSKLFLLAEVGGVVSVEVELKENVAVDK